MSVHDRLLELGHLRDEALPPPVTTVLREGRRLRRQRSAVRATGVATLAAAGVGFVALGLSRPDSPAARLYAAGPTLASVGAAATPGDCRGLPDAETRDDPRLHYTLKVPPAGMHEELARARTGEWCAGSATPLVALDTRADGRVLRALAVWGPAADTSGLGDRTRSTQVRGVTATLWSGDDDGADAVAWTEPDGSRWLATSSGMAEAELLELVKAMTLDGDTGAATLAASELRGLKLEDTIAYGVPARFTTGWTLLYTSGSAAPVQVSVSVTRTGPSPFAEAAWPGSGATVVTVRGQRGLYLAAPNAAARREGTLIWSEYGNTVRLSAPNPTAHAGELQALAERLSAPQAR